MKFRVRASKEAYITLSSDIKATNPVAEICIGCNDNQNSSLFTSESSTIITNTTNVLSPIKYSRFWVRVKNNIISIGHGIDYAPFLAWQASEQIAVKYIAFRTRAGDGSWIVESDLQ